MGQEDKDTNFLLGQLSGKMDSLFLTTTQSGQAFSAHAASDEKNFEQIVKQITEVSRDMGKLRERFAYYVGAAAVVASLLSLAIPKIINLL